MKGWWNPGIYGRGKASNCDVHAQGQWQNQGCSHRGLAGTVGPSFNAGGGGTYAAEWDPLAGHMRVWFWPSGSEPEDAKGPTPDPELWGQPDFYFELSDVCAKSHFKNMKLVFDITFCGDLGSPTFHEHCGAKAGHSNCDAFVRQELLKCARLGARLCCESSVLLAADPRNLGPFTRLTGGCRPLMFTTARRAWIAPEPFAVPL